MKKVLKPHQEKAIKYLGSRFGGLLFMEMRLGKNLTMLRHLIGCNIHDHVLVITEYGAMQSFEDELNEEGEKVTVLEGVRNKRLDLLSNSDGGWIISNYESAKRLDLHKYKWKVVILDETIKIANPKSQRTKYFLSAFENVRLKYVLNGKPLPESMLQLCCQFLFVHGVYMGCKNFWQYRAKYYVSDKNGFNWEPKHGHLRDVSEYVHKHAFVMTRKEANVGPEKVYTKRIVRMSDPQRKAQKELIEFMEFDGREYKNELGVQIGLRYIAGGTSPSEQHTELSTNKVKEMIHIINQEVNDAKFLIWCFFKAEIDLICRHLSMNSIGHISICGDQNKAQRQERKLFYENNVTSRCAVLTIPSCAKGQDWAVADTAIYYSADWSNDKMGQSEDRPVHMEKTYPLHIITLITEDSIDEEMYISRHDKEYTSDLIMSKFFEKHKRKKLKWMKKN